MCLAPDIRGAFRKLFKKRVNRDPHRIPVRHYKADCTQAAMNAKKAF
jgi:hypothetical protein